MEAINITTTQKAFNDIQKRIEEHTERMLTMEGESMKMFMESEMKHLKRRLSEISMELTAERHATQY